MGRLMPVVMLVVGTRPEAIKMAPVAQAIQACPALSLHLCASGQHDERLFQASQNSIRCEMLLGTSRIMS